MLTNEGNNVYKLILTAQWEANEYKITLNGNEPNKPVGVAKINGKDLPQTLVEEVSYDKAIELALPTLTGYAFDGWYWLKHNPETEEAPITIIDDITGSASLTAYLMETNKATGIYICDGKYYAFSLATGVGEDEVADVNAHWIANTYTITYHANNGTEDIIVSDPIEYDTDTTIAINSFGKLGWHFVNWNTKADGSGTGYNAEVVLTKPNFVPTGTFDLYAIWSENEYTITYHANNGTEDIIVSDPIKYGADTTIETNQFTYTGYKFVEWNTLADGNGESYNVEATVSNLTNDNNGTFDLYAIWETDEFAIHYVENDGSEIAGASDLTVYYNDTTNKQLAEISKTGYTHLGWAFEPNQTVVSEIDEIDPSFTLEKNEVLTQEAINWLYENKCINGIVTLYAVWSANTYTIVYHANNGTDATKSSGDALYDNAFKLNENEFTYSDHVFAGWSTSSEYASAQEITYIGGYGSLTEFLVGTISDSKVYVYNNEYYAFNLASTSGGTADVYAVWVANTNVQYKIELYTPRDKWHCWRASCIGPRK